MIARYLQDAADLVRQINPYQVAAVADQLENLRERGGRLFILGNGGGAAHASHAAADFRKLAKIEAYAWGDNLADLTAYTNDLSWEAAAASWLEDSRCGHDDAILIFSVGGASRDVSANLKEAVFWAVAGPTILGVVGEAGGYVAAHADACVVLPTGSTPHVEGLQAVVWHCLVSELAPC